MAIVNDDKMIGEGVAQEVINFFFSFCPVVACMHYIHRQLFQSWALPSSWSVRHTNSH